ncbi:CTP synthase [Patellaria atrata CBS 101060]|uniref:CTP synthase n=1 Tax=Patellaria atrata CBS 101060 TaxID=1346257 RepID=A0A9P4VNZ9_9PEZI|nr:CTP synthase [Patellaria atrata CBS 101060]
MKYVLVSGGVISGVGKGIIASSTGLLLKTTGLKVSSIKVDPYINIDAGTMNPKEHGEVFVLDDGGEVDLDLGNYERYLNITLTRENNITTGKIYKHVIERERKGDYLGKTVQVVPHVTDAIQEWIERVAKLPVDDTKEEPDVCIIELGGTVGDIESMPFVEAMTQLRRRAGKNNFIQIHVSYIPLINGEQKTKPTQQAIKMVRSAGLIPDLIACRCEVPLEPSTVDKLARFCQVELEQVVVVRDMPSIYQVPVLLEEQGLVPLLADVLKLGDMELSKSLIAKGANIWHQWKALTIKDTRFLDPVNIVLVGKYTELHDSYLSVIKSLEHSAMRCRRALKLIWVDSEHLELKTQEKEPANYHKAWHDVCTADGILVPGGFGYRGTEGMMAAAKRARENGTPYLGICLGMQIAVIEYARNLCGITDASSEEFREAPSDNKVIVFMPEIDKETMGGTMRLGRRPTIWQEGSEWSKLRALYGQQKEIHERHRHRYEVNPKYIEKLSQAGLNFVGKDDKGERMEIIELKNHPWFVGVQYHPEYLSRVLDPSRPYLGFVAASAKCLDEITKQMGWKKDGLVNGTNGVNGADDGTHF